MPILCLRHRIAALVSALSLGILALGIASGSTRADSPPTPTPFPTPAFVFAEGSTLVAFDPDASDCRPGQPVAGYGWLFDTSALNLFTTTTYDGNTPLARRFTLTERVRQEPHSGAWVRLGGRCTPGGGLNALHVMPVPATDAAVDTAITEACAWVEDHRTGFDFNAYKTTDRFQQAFIKLYASLDINTTEFRPAAEVVFVDTTQQIAGIDCGRYVLGETVQRGDYLSLLGIVYLDEGHLSHVIVRNTGFFLE